MLRSWRKKIVLLLPAVLSYNHDNLVKEKQAPLQALLDFNAAELKKIVLLLPAVLCLDHGPRQPGEGETGATASISGFGWCCGAEEDRAQAFSAGLYNHDNLVKEKLAPLQPLLGLNAAELKKIVL
jgi:hypothetical protein